MTTDSTAARTPAAIPPPIRPPGWWPTADPSGHAAVFSALDDKVPVLFSPVRIETRFTRPAAGRARALRVRIYPDQFHLDDHDPRLSEREVAIGREYWRAWSAAEARHDEAAQTAARQWLVAHLPARRAAWVARQTRPNPTQHPTHPDPIHPDQIRPDPTRSDPTRSDPTPAATRPEGQAPQAIRPDQAKAQAPAASPPGREGAVTSQTRAPRADCLPDRWAVLGFTRAADGTLTQAFTVWSGPVRADLAAGVDWGQYGSVPAPGDLPVDDGMRWMVDYDEAVRAGMAVTIDLAKLPEVAGTGLAVLLVLGVSGGDPAQSTATLDTLLRAHRYADGMAFVPAGTPTNNTDQVSSPFSFREADPLALLARELDGAGAGTPDSNGRRLARALGSPGGGLFPALENADDDEESGQAAMNRALWPVTWGAYVDQLLAGVHTGSVLPANASADLKRRFLRDVRGGAPLPTLRIGAQPYGLLPVRYSQPPQLWADQSPWYEYALHFFRPQWMDVADSVVPRMSPVLGAAGGSTPNQPDSVLTEILGTLPQPGRFLVRELRSWRTTDTESIDELGDVILSALLPFLYYDDPTFGYEALSVLGRWGWALAILGGADYLGLPASVLAPLDDTGLPGADAQIDALNRLRGRVDSLLSGGTDADSARAWIDSMVTLVRQHQERQSPLRELAAGALDFAGIIADEVDDPTIFYAVYARDEDTTVFDLPLVHSAHRSTAGYLAALRDRLGVPTPSTARQALPPGFHDAEPLLYQLLDGVVDGIAEAESDAYRGALDELAAQPEDQLELRLRESLGLACHRLDAYFTGLARHRLDELRDADPDRGVQLGCYGWVMDLVPDRAGTRPSQGFLHTPSIQQATTAAILRAGWSAHGTASGDSQLAVDLSSRRVRLAAWLLDGVRQGQSLGELLGYRFERGLHDGALDAWIDPVRRAVLLDAGTTRAPRDPVDGLDLLDLYARRPSPAALLAQVPAGYLPRGSAEVLRTQLDALSEALDAVGDSAIAESVHQVAQGNMTRAAATLDALNQGEVAPPELLSLDTPASGDSVTHRVVLLLGDGAPTPGWAADTVRAGADPALDAWVGSVLGPATAIGARVRPVDEAGVAGDWQPVTLDQLGLSALDAVFEAPPPVPTVACPLGRRIEAALRDQVPAGQPQPASVEVDFAGAAAGQLPMSEVGELLRQLRAVIARSRPLTAADLAPPTAPDDDEPVPPQIRARVRELEYTFRTRAGALLALLPSTLSPSDKPRPAGTASPAELRAAMRSLAEYPLPGAVPVDGYRGDPADLDRLWQAAWSLGDKVARVLSRLDKPQPQQPPQTWQAILGRAYPLIAPVTPPEGGPCSGAFDRGDGLADSCEVFNFVSQAGRVRPDLRRLDQVAMLGELLHNQTVLRWRVAQLPEVPDDPWVATGRPVPDTGGRTHWLAVDHRDPVADGPVAGLFLDGWVERVPRRTQTTGVALHYDTPASRPPQSLLLAVTPDDATAWSFDLVVATLMQVLEDARMRAVSPQALPAYGHHLPLIFSPGRITGAATGDGSVG